MGTGRLVRRLAPLVAALAAGAALAGCADEARIAQARGFRDAPLYWVGTEFAGLPIIGIGMHANGGGMSYGTCDPPPDEGGCQPPLQIQTVRMCPQRIGFAPLTDRRRLRGVPAGMRGGGIVLLSRDVEVRVFAVDPAVALRAVAALRSTNPNGPDAVRRGEPFPAPPPGAEGRTPCK